MTLKAAYSNYNSKTKTPFRKGRANKKADISWEYTLLLIQISIQYNL
jgi:hypothetical protein